MTKLFLKLWILILLTSFSSYLIQSYFFSWSAERTATNNSNERFRRTYVFIEEVLAPLTQLGVIRIAPQPLPVVTRLTVGYIPAMMRLSRNGLESGFL